MKIFRKCFSKKGQGIVEYAILLAFIVGLAVMLQGVGLAKAVTDVFDDVADFLAYRTYSEYYADLHNATNAQLSDVANSKRIKADQEGLQALVQNLIGLSKEDALAELQKLMPGATANDVNPDANGDSKTLTLLTYWDHYDANPPYVTLGSDANINAVNYVTGDKAVTYKQNASDNTLKKTGRYPEIEFSIQTV